MIRDYDPQQLKVKYPCLYLEKHLQTGWNKPTKQDWQLLQKYVTQLRIPQIQKDYIHFLYTHEQTK